MCVQPRTHVPCGLDQTKNTLELCPACHVYLMTSLMRRETACGADAAHAPPPAWSPPAAGVVAAFDADATVPDAVLEARLGLATACARDGNLAAAVQQRLQRARADYRASQLADAPAALDEPAVAAWLAAWHDAQGSVATLHTKELRAQHGALNCFIFGLAAHQGDTPALPRWATDRYGALAEEMGRRQDAGRGE